jgi:hypothetical protein
MFKHITFSSASTTALDQLVNNYIGRQTIDGRTILREVLFYNSFVIGTTIYATLVVQETNQTA